MDRQIQHRRRSLSVHAVSPHRAHFRNVHLFDGAKPNVVLGGLVQNGSITEKNLLTMLNIFLVTASAIRVSAKGTGKLVSAVDTRLDEGDYVVSCEGKSSTVLVRMFPS